MAVRLKPVSEQVIVITGATSGIGLATARAAAAQGAKLVLTAREEETLADITRDISDSGAEVAFAAADVGRREELVHVADVAVERFGGFDSWINNAGVSIWGRLDEVNDEDHRKLFDTNFWGAVNGSLIAAEHLRNRGGAIINVGSVAGDFALPLQGMYSASKHALRGFTDALRMELERDEAPIAVTLIKPTSINTPFPQHARNYTDREPKLPPPVYEPEEVARAILYAAARPERDIYVGGSGRLMAGLASRAPRAMDWIGENILAEQELRDEPARHRMGALYRAGVSGRVHGDEPGYVFKTSLYTRAALHPVITSTAAGLAIAIGAAATAWLMRDHGYRWTPRNGGRSLLRH
jgi:short-subunit dehydrogenase